jgi:hypothetical protein
MTFEERLRARRAQIRTQLEGTDVTLLPYYGSARDRIVQPDRALLVRSYFVERWLPRLTGDEVKIVIVLRNLARAHGLEASAPVVEVTIRHLVELTGISRGTLNRLLAADHLRESALGRFIQKQAQRVPGIIGTIQGPNIYHVRMDDPIAPEDEPALREALADLEMERRYGALLAQELSLGNEADLAPRPEPQLESRAAARAESQTEAQSEPEAGSRSAKQPVSQAESQAIPLRRRGSAARPEAQNRATRAERRGASEGQINAAQHMLTNVPNAGREAPGGSVEPLPRDLLQAQRDLHARRLARSFQDADSMGWYRRVVLRFMEAGHEDLLHGIARDVLELPDERVRTTRARVFTDRVKRVAAEYGIDLNRDDPNPS